MAFLFLHTDPEHFLAAIHLDTDAQVLAAFRGHDLLGRTAAQPPLYQRDCHGQGEVVWVKVDELEIVGEGELESEAIELELWIEDTIIQARGPAVHCVKPFIYKGAAESVI